MASGNARVSPFTTCNAKLNVHSGDRVEGGGEGGVSVVAGVGHPLTEQ